MTPAELAQVDQIAAAGRVPLSPVDYADLTAGQLRTLADHHAEQLASAEARIQAFRALFHLLSVGFLRPEDDGFGHAHIRLAAAAAANPDNGWLRTRAQHVASILEQYPDLV